MSYKDIIKNMDLKDMKLRRMDVCIKVMQRVVDLKRAFNLGSWQQSGIKRKKEKALHNCGSAACFGGWLAVSPEFQRAGGSVSDMGKTVFDGHTSYPAINAYLGLESGHEFGDEFVYTCSDIYNDCPRPITAKNVITRLKYAKQVAIQQKAQA